MQKGSKAAVDSASNDSEKVGIRGQAPASILFSCLTLATAHARRKAVAGTLLLQEYIGILQGCTIST